MGAAAPETCGMPKHADQQVVDSPKPHGDGSVPRKRTTGHEPRCARRWTEDDDAFIELHCESMTDAAMATALGRSKAAIGLRRLKTLQLPKMAKPDRWSSEENHLFHVLYGEVDTLFLAAVLSRPASTLRSRAFGLGLHRRKPWSHDEDEILRRRFPSTSVTDFVEMLPGRGLNSIYRRAEALLLTRDLSFLISGSSYAKFRAYPPQLRTLMQLHKQVERKLRDVQTQY